MEPCMQEKRITTHGVEIDNLRDRFLEHLAGGKTWRITITATLISTICLLAIQLVSAIFFVGKMTNMLEVHDKNISRLENKVLR